VVRIERLVEMSDFPALPGFYNFLFLHLEPISAIGPIIMTLISGPSAFYNEVIPPTGPPPENMDPRAAMAIWQLSISYLLLFLLTSLGYRAARDALRNDPVSQERIVGGLMTALAIIDIVHAGTTFTKLPDDVKYTPRNWNTTTHGNVSFCVILHVTRICWFLGVGRKRYYYGQPDFKLTTPEKSN